MKIFERTPLTQRQWERIASRIILVENGTSYKAHLGELALATAPGLSPESNATIRRVSVIPEGIPLTTDLASFEWTEITSNWHWVWIGTVNPERVGHRIVRDTNMRPMRIFRTQPAYSEVTVNGKRTTAHRALYEHFVSGVPRTENDLGRSKTIGRMQCDCGIHLCVNPRHWSHQIDPRHIPQDEPPEAKPEPNCPPASAPVAENFYTAPIFDATSCAELLEEKLDLGMTFSSLQDVLEHPSFEDYTTPVIIEALQRIGKAHLMPGRN